MSPKEQAQHLSNAISFVQQRILEIERTLYTTPGVRYELTRQKRVLRALTRDLDKLVKTIPAPVQFGLPGFTDGDAPRVAPSEFSSKASFEDDRVDTLPGGAETL